MCIWKNWTAEGREEEENYYALMLIEYFFQCFFFLNCSKMQKFVDFLNIQFVENFRFAIILDKYTVIKFLLRGFAMTIIFEIIQIYICKRWFVKISKTDIFCYNGVVSKKYLKKCSNWLQNSYLGIDFQKKILEILKMSIFWWNNQFIWNSTQTNGLMSNFYTWKLGIFILLFNLQLKSSELFQNLILKIRGYLKMMFWTLMSNNHDKNFQILKLDEHLDVFFSWIFEILSIFSNLQLKKFESSQNLSLNVCIILKKYLEVKFLQ